MKRFRIVADHVFAFGGKRRKGEIVEGDFWARLGPAAVVEVLPTIALKELPLKEAPVVVPEPTEPPEPPKPEVLAVELAPAKPTPVASATAPTVDGPAADLEGMAEVVESLDAVLTGKPSKRNRKPRN